MLRTALSGARATRRRAGLTALASWDGRQSSSAAVVGGPRRWRVTDPGSTVSPWYAGTTRTAGGGPKRPRPEQPEHDDDTRHFISEDASRLAERMRAGSADRERTRGTLWQALAANAIATALKGTVWLSTGSSAMFAETVHSAVDTANQAVLNRGHIEAAFEPDVKHQYGYGKAQYVWGLVSAMGILWMGAGIAVYRGLDALASPPAHLDVPWEAWGALGFSFLLDGYVLVGATTEIARRAARDDPAAFLPLRELAGRTVGRDGRVKVSASPSLLAMAAAAPGAAMGRVRALLSHVRGTRDTSVAAVFLEDMAGCIGVTMAAAGLLGTKLTGDTTWDAVATLSIGGLLGAVALQLLERNRQLLLGEAVAPHTVSAITALVASRPAIEGVREVQSQWISPDTFAYKAEVDFDGTVLAAQLLDEYRDLFLGAADLEAELPVLLSLYAEDVTRAVERELKATEAVIRLHYPGAAFIELEPDSLAADERMSDRATSVEGRRGERRQLLASLLAQLQARALARGKGSMNEVQAAAEEARVREWFQRAEGMGASVPGREVGDGAAGAGAAGLVEEATAVVLAAAPHSRSTEFWASAVDPAQGGPGRAELDERWSRAKQTAGDARKDWGRRSGDGK